MLETVAVLVMYAIAVSICPWMRDDRSINSVGMRRWLHWDHAILWLDVGVLWCETIYRCGVGHSISIRKCHWYISRSLFEGLYVDMVHIHPFKVDGIE